MKIALSVQEGEKQEKFNDVFYTRFHNSVSLQSYSLSRTRQEDCQPRRSADATRAVSLTPGQHYNSPRNAGEPTTLATRNAQTTAAFRCYECEGVGHFARVCPTRHKREVNSTNSPGRRNPSERSRRSRSPDDKPPRGIKKGE